jgi:hypothetical protein
MITGSIRIDLSASTWDNDRYAGVWDLQSAPDAVRVVLVVGKRTDIHPEVMGLLHRHESRLQVDIQGDVQAVRHWMAELRGPVDPARSWEPYATDRGGA